MGLRDLPPTSRVLDDAAPTAVLATRDPAEALADLHEREVRHVLLEGGPTLAAAFLVRGLVDEVVAYVAPVLLGAGLSSVADLGVGTITDAVRLEITDARTVGTGPEADLRLTLTPAHHHGRQ